MTERHDRTTMGGYHASVREAETTKYGHAPKVGVFGVRCEVCGRRVGSEPGGARVHREGGQVMSDQCGLCRRPLADHVSEDGSEGACRYADAPEDRAFLTDPWGLDR